MNPIEDEWQLRVALERIVRLYGQAEREAAETAWDSETRQEIVEETNQLRVNLEREVAAYLARKHNLISTESSRKRPVPHTIVQGTDKGTMTQNA